MKKSKNTISFLLFVLLVFIGILDCEAQVEFRKGLVVGITHAKTDVTSVDIPGTSNYVVEDFIPQTYAYVTSELLGKDAAEPEWEMQYKTEKQGGLRLRLGYQAGLYDQFWSLSGGVYTSKYSKTWLPKNISLEADADIAPIGVLALATGGIYGEFLEECVFLGAKYVWDPGTNPLINVGGQEPTKTWGFGITPEIRYDIGGDQTIQVGIEGFIDLLHGLHYASMYVIF